MAAACQETGEPLAATGDLCDDRLVKVSTAPQHQDTVSVGHKKQSSGHMARRNSLDSYELCLYFGAASEEISHSSCW